MEFLGQQLTIGTFFFLLLALALALSFEFVNGFHDTANAVATVIYTHTLKPTVAVVWSGCWKPSARIHTPEKSGSFFGSVCVPAPVGLRYEPLGARPANGSRPAGRVAAGPGAAACAHARVGFPRRR